MGYEDIINREHFRSSTRQPMSMESRAAQFAPFAALSGHEDAIAETSRLTKNRIELTEEEKESVSLTVRTALENALPVSVTYFIADKTKSGGEYQTISGNILKIEETDRLLHLSPSVIIHFDDILSVKII